jgi:cysteine desulfurase / selenocysteine lyase
MSALWQEVREQFPALKGRTFLNTATYGQTPRRAVEAMHRHLARRDEHACTDFLTWFDDMDAIRALCGRLIHCEPADIAFIHSASLGLATFLNGLQWTEGDEVVTVENEFPNNLYQRPVLARAGVEFRVVPFADLQASLTAKTRVVILSALNYGTGFRAPLETLGPALKSRGILLYVDGTQGCGALQYDMRAIQPAAFAVDAYKWMLTPNGGGFLYIDPALRPALAPMMAGWRSDRNWRQVNNLNHGDPIFSDDAERYEGGMICFPSIYAMGAVLEMMLEIGPAAIETRVLELADGVRKVLLDGGALDVNKDHSPIVTAAFETDPGALAVKLKERGVIVSARHGRLRVSPHFYNTSEDLDRLAAALHAS